MHTVCIGVSSYVVFSMIAYVAWPQLPADVTASRRVVVVRVDRVDRVLPSSFVLHPGTKGEEVSYMCTYTDIPRYI